jgi:hypothetical protein
VRADTGERLVRALVEEMAKGIAQAILPCTATTERPAGDDGWAELGRLLDRWDAEDLAAKGGPGSGPPLGNQNARKPDHGERQKPKKPKKPKRRPTREEAQRQRWREQLDRESRDYQALVQARLNAQTYKGKPEDYLDDRDQQRLHNYFDKFIWAGENNAALQKAVTVKGDSDENNTYRDSVNLKAWREWTNEAINNLNMPPYDYAHPDNRTELLKQLPRWPWWLPEPTVKERARLLFELREALVAIKKNGGDRNVLKDLLMRDDRHWPEIDPRTGQSVQMGKHGPASSDHKPDWKNPKWPGWPGGKPAARPHLIRP